MTEPILEVRALTCERGERTLFQGLSFAVEPGTLVRIAGSNGAGMLQRWGSLRTGVEVLHGCRQLVP